MRRIRRRRKKCKPKFPQSVVAYGRRRRKRRRVRKTNGRRKRR